MKKENKKTGRPKKYNIQKEKVEQLASFGCTNTEIASFFGCDVSLITKTYSQFLTKGRDKGKIRLRQLQWKSAEKGNTAMLIWLGKQILNQTDKSEVELVKPIEDILFDEL
jgi:hypothetical protein|tara:strand:+ start:669 stop:1001 length:333 start_codon:yes stop_codon:yes gene_type:complete